MSHCLKAGIPVGVGCSVTRAPRGSCREVLKHLWRTCDTDLRRQRRDPEEK